ncbi:MAG TPA: autotransporter assembly complex family protein [Thermoanaerobaculia bacterium]|nr:autotransporter assembly complex family protein [Thermoanaerobaculia bacterium]
MTSPGCHRRSTARRRGPTPAPGGRRSPPPLLALLWVSAALLPAAARAAESLKVEVDGLRGELRKNVLETLDIEEARKDKDLDESRIRRLHALAPQDIGAALQPFGYYRPVVQGSLTRQGATWVARYSVDQGPQLKVTGRDIQVAGEGASDPGFQGLVRSFPLQEGGPLLEIAYEEGKKAFDDYAAESGYLDAAFRTNQIRIDLATYTSEVVVHYDTGPRFRFGPVSFHQDILRPELLEGYINFKRGDPLAASTLLALQEALADSPYFSRVEVVPRRDLAEGVEVPIDVDLVPAKVHKWTAGVGYGTDTGPRGTAGLEIRRLNSRGHRADVEGKASLVEKSLKTDYILPGGYPRTDLLTFTAGFADLRPKTSHSKTELIGAGLTEKVGRWRQGLSLNFQRETFTVGVDNGISTLVIPQLSWSRVWADDRIFPSHGEKYEFIARGAAKALLSNATFAQAHATAKFIHSLGGRRFRLINRVEAGFTATNDFRKLPPTSRFFAGGDQSVRGYGYQELGSLDEKGHVIGGRDLLAASVELEYRFLQKWGVATFYDAGNAALSFGSGLRSGTGVGLRWLSPIGMVRVDVAWAVSRPGSPIRLHLYLGPDL